MAIKHLSPRSEEELSKLPPYKEYDYLGFGNNTISGNISELTQLNYIYISGANTCAILVNNEEYEYEVYK